MDSDKLSRIEAGFYDEIVKIADLNPAVWGSLIGGAMAPQSTSRLKGFLGGAATGALGTGIANLGNFASFSPLLSGGLMLGGSLLGGLSGLMKSNAIREREALAAQMAPYARR